MSKDAGNNLSVNKVYRDILALYPFLSEDEKNNFQKNSKKLIDNSGDDFRKIEGVLNLLENPHADIKEVVSSSGPKKSLAEKLKQIQPTYEIKDQILYLKIPSWNKNLEGLDKKLINICQDNFTKYKGIIIDVRENPGGNSYLAHGFAGIFFEKNVIFGRIFRRIKNKGLRIGRYILKANKEIFNNKPLAILISKKCFSSNELFIAPFKVSGRAILIGEKTAGGSAAPVFEDLEINKKKYLIRIPTYRFYITGKKKPIEQTKIEPDIIYTKEDIINFAQQYLNDSKENL